MLRVVASAGLVMMVAIVLVSCTPAGAATATQAPTQGPPTPTTGAPNSTPTEPAPTAAPIDVPTATTAAGATATTPRESVSFRWAPGSVTPSDADDVADLLIDLRTHDGILGGSGDENGIMIFYDPTVITVEEIMALFDSIGHPVVEQ